MKAPKVDVSVIVTCYLKEEFLNECLESIKRQTRQPKEIILVHDACENPMAHVIATTIILPENVGVAKARDIGFNYSTGKLILFVDGDDVLSPDYLEKMALVIADGADITYPDIYIWNEESPELSVPEMKITSRYIKKLSRMPVPVTSLMKREVYEKLNGFKEMEVLEDVDFFIRALCKGYTFKKAHTLLWYRKYGKSRQTEVSEKKRKEVFAGILAQLNVPSKKQI